MKNKFDYSFTVEEKLAFQRQVLSHIQNISFESIIVPETGNQCLLEIAANTNKPVYILKKNTKEAIFQALEKQAFMKTEKTKLFNIIESLSVVKMVDMPGNQRKRFIDCLFQDIELNPDKKYLFLDDSVFSGHTYAAAQKKISQYTHENLILFNKQVEA